MSIFVTMVIVFIFSLKYMNLFLIGWVIMIICKDMNEPNKNSLHVFFFASTLFGVQKQMHKSKLYWKKTLNKFKIMFLKFKITSL